MPGACGDTAKDIIEAVKNGTLDEKVLDENVDRLLTLIFDTEEVFKVEYIDGKIDRQSGATVYL